LSAECMVIRYHFLFDILVINSIGVVAIQTK
jgi:hypothetical protein